jgi:hypothetical protein
VIHYFAGTCVEYFTDRFWYRGTREDRRRSYAIFRAGTAIAGSAVQGEIFTHHRDMAIMVLILNVVLYALIRQKLSPPFYTAAIDELYIFDDHVTNSNGYIIILLGIAASCAGLAYCVGEPYFGAQFYLLLNLFNRLVLQGDKQMKWSDFSN